MPVVYGMARNRRIYCHTLVIHSAGSGKVIMNNLKIQLAHLTFRQPHRGVLGAN